MAQQGGGQQQGDQTSSFFWYVVLLTVAAIIVWITCKKYLVPPLFYLRHAEVTALIWVLNLWNSLAGILSLPLASLTQLHQVLQFMHYADPANVTIDQIDRVSTVIGQYYRYPIICVAFILAYLCAFRHRSAIYTATYSMKTLRNAEVEHWPQITPVIGRGIIEQDINQGEWSMSTLPLDFAKQYDLLFVKSTQHSKFWAVHQGAAERQFVMQMGALWEGVDQLPMHMQALVVVFMLRLARKRALSEEILNQIGASAKHKKLDFSMIAGHIDQYKQHHVIRWIEGRHAYVYTVLASLLEIARTEGVIATAEFLWLKPLDRRLWYVLNTVGRVTAVPEVAGVFAHWQAEKKLGRPMRTPVVTEAVQALDKAVSEILYVEEGATWDINSAG